MIIIKMKKMFAYLEVFIGVIFIIIALLFINILTWNPYKKNKHTDINADYYDLKRKDYIFHHGAKYILPDKNPEHNQSQRLL